jgi:hypothetical protein
MFVHRVIRVKMEGNGASATFEGLRTMVRVVKAGSPYYGQAQITLFGLSLEHINDLSTRMLLFRPYLNYEVTIEAGDAVNGMWQIFKGTVQQSWGDFTNMPEVAFYVSAYGSSAPATAASVPPTSASGGVQVAPLVQKLSQLGGLGFQNYGVNSKLHNVYTWGSPWKQIREIAQAANFNAFVDDKVCKIWPKNKPITGNFLVSAKTGMRDYPSFTRNGIHVKVEYSRPIDYASSITVQSDLRDANGTWFITSVDYDLAAELPGGPWYVMIDAMASSGQPSYYNASI